MAGNEKVEQDKNFMLEYGSAVYPLPTIDTWSFAERNLVRRLTGLKLAEIFDDNGGIDSDGILAVLIVALKRAGNADADIRSVLEATPGDVEVFDQAERDRDAVQEELPTPAVPVEAAGVETEHAPLPDSDLVVQTPATVEA